MDCMDEAKALDWGGGVTSDQTGERFCALADVQAMDKAKRKTDLVVTLRADKRTIHVLIAAIIWLVGAYTSNASAQSGLFPDLGPLRPADPGNWLIGRWSVIGLPQCHDIPFEVKMAEVAQTHVAQIYD